MLMMLMAITATTVSAADGEGSTITPLTITKCAAFWPICGVVGQANAGGHAGTKLLDRRDMVPLHFWLERCHAELVLEQ
jgi:hypothetical protein